MLDLTTKILLGVIAALGIVLGVTQCKLAQAVERGAQLALREDSTEAARDSTRELALEQLADTLRAWQRRSIQQPQLEDAIDRGLKKHGVEERVARTELVAEVRQLRARIEATPGTTREDTLGTRTAQFAIAQPPYRGTAAVVVPRPPDPATIDLAIQVDPATIDLRLGCGAANDDGIRSATVNATAPAWLTVTFPRVEQDPGVCRSPALEGNSSSWGFAVGPAYAGIIDMTTGQLVHGPGISGTITVPWRDLFRWRPWR